MTNRLGARLDRLEGPGMDDEEDGDWLFIHVREGQEEGPEVKAARTRATAMDVPLLVLRTPKRNALNRWNSLTPPGVAVPLSQLDDELLDVAIERIAERVGSSGMSAP